jgi:hypothetical protein
MSLLSGVTSLRMLLSLAILLAARTMRRTRMVITKIDSIVRDNERGIESDH